MEKNTSKSSGKKQSQSAWMALKLAWEMGYLIAIPVVLFGMGGAYLDKSLQTMPLFTLLGFALAAAISFVAVRRRLVAILPD